MSRSTFAFCVAVALLEAAGAVAIVAGSHNESHKYGTAALALTAGLTFVISGLIAIRRRPDNRTGFYLAAVGYLWFLGALNDANDDVVYSIGVVLGNLAFIPFAALVLAFPTGRLTTRVDRLLVKATIAFVLVGPLASLLVQKTAPGCGHSCGTSAIVVYDSHTVAAVVDTLVTLAALGLIGSVVVVLVHRWRRASPALRRTLGPVYLAGVAALAALFAGNLVSRISTVAGDVLDPIFLLLFATVPIAFLIGILRSRFARGSVAGLLVSIGQGTPARDALAEALGDPSLELAYWLEHLARYADGEGRPVELPEPGSGRSLTRVERDGRVVAALVHDASLDEEPELVESVAAAAALVLDNERLQAQLREQYALLATIVDTAPSLLVGIDPTGRIVDLNPATLRASGYDDDADVRGRLFWEVFIDPDERPDVIARFHAAAPSFPAAEYENAFTNARGEPLVIAWRSAPWSDESGAVVGIIAGGIDITERKRQEAELRASRARIVSAADDARRRLERNLHDGAQQRLVSLSLSLRLARSKLAGDPAGTAEILSGASDELTRALEELRELARGIHPAILTDRGLAAALEALAARAPLPVEVTPIDAPLPEAIEAAAYYVVSESIANVVKHADASHVEVRLWTRNGSVRIEVLDDGVGGAHPEGGSGLRGLADRVAALDGRLAVESPETGGTRVVAEIPLS